MEQKRIIRFAILAAFGIVCCRTPTETAGPGRVGEEQEADRVDEFWKANVAVIQKAIDGRPGLLNLKEFSESIEFFEAVTRIQSHTNASYVGRLPGPGLGEALESWQNWYAENKDSLYWDDTWQTVRSTDRTESEKAEEIWYLNLAVVLKAANSPPEAKNPEKYSEAVEFFQKITGIIPPHAGTLQGTTSGPELDETLDSWFAWYAENKDRLYWDESAQTVRLKKND